MLSHTRRDRDWVQGKERGGGEGEHEQSTHVFFFPPPSLLLSLQTITPPVIKTNVRRGSADNDRSAWISAHKEKTAGHGTGGTRIASRTRHPVSRCLPPTSTRADEETVASYHRVSLAHNPMQPRSQTAGCCRSWSPKPASSCLFRCALLWRRKTGNYAPCWQLWRGAVWIAHQQQAGL